MPFEVHAFDGLLPNVKEPPYSTGEAGLTGHIEHKFFKQQPIPPGPVGSPVLTTAFAGAKIEFLDPDGTGFVSVGIIVVNDHGTNWIQFSFDGVNVHGTVNKQDTIEEIFQRQRVIWFRGQAGGEPYKLFVW